MGAVVDLGLCLDLVSSNGIRAIEAAHSKLAFSAATSGIKLPQNSGGHHYALRKLDCAVINFLHRDRLESDAEPFDSVRGVFNEGERIYKNSGFRHKTHIQICVRNPDIIKGVFRVPDRHFSGVERE